MGEPHYVVKIECAVKITPYFRDEYLNVFKIPPDFDDTFVNIGLGSLLINGGHYPVRALQWKNKNQNLTSVFDSLKRYAYR